MQEVALKARQAAQKAADCGTAAKNQALHNMIGGLQTYRNDILKANQNDMELARQKNKPQNFIDRLVFDEGRIEKRIQAVEVIASLPDPVGQTIHAERRPNGLDVRKVRTPLGVILMIYESRPHVTVNAGAFCLKSGNASLLRGGSDVSNTNVMIGKLWQQALHDAGLPEEMIQVITLSHEEIEDLIGMEDYVDLLIPRGSKRMVNKIASTSTIPVLKHSDGVCHAFIDANACPQSAVSICLDSKCVMPEVCNALETVLVHQDWLENMPALIKAFQQEGVSVKGCKKTQESIVGTETALQIDEATEEDWSTEYLDMVVSIRVVDDVNQAIDHIERYGSHHTDTIVTDSIENQRIFSERLSSSVVLVNASTMFNDGFSLGMGAEIGISTNKLHARGPMGLEELTSYQWVIQGKDHIYDKRYQK